MGTALLFTACAGWKATTVTPVTPLAPRQQAQLFLHDGRLLEWQSLRVTADSISGVPFIVRPDCDSCRIGVLRSTVDSIRLGDRETMGVLIGAAPFIALIAIGLAFQLSGGVD